jgi:hypothetical protein
MRAMQVASYRAGRWLEIPTRVDATTAIARKRRFKGLP